MRLRVRLLYQASPRYIHQRLRRRRLQLCRRSFHPTYHLCCPRTRLRWFPHLLKPLQSLLVLLMLLMLPRLNRLVYLMERQMKRQVNLQDLLMRPISQRRRTATVLKNPRGLQTLPINPQRNRRDLQMPLTLPPLVGGY